MKQFYNKKKGQALLFILFLVFLVAILISGLASMWKTEIQIRTLEKNGILVFYLAQAGIERAKIEARYAVITADSGWNNLDGGRYNYAIANVPNQPNQRELIGTGQITGGGNNIIAMRQIRVIVQGIETPFVDSSDDAQVPRSWREQ